MKSKQYAVTLAAVLCASFASFGAANASTAFDITGSGNYSGTLTIDTVGGSLTAADVVVTGGTTDFTDILSSTQGATDFVVSLTNTTISPGPILVLSFNDGGTLVGFAGGSIDTANIVGGCNLISGQCRGVPTSLGTADLTPPVVGAAPLPGTLALFASGLGVVGYLTGRKRRKEALIIPRA